MGNCLAIPKQHHGALRSQKPPQDQPT